MRARVLQLALVVVFLGLLVMPAVMMYAPKLIEQKPLSGVLPELPAPPLKAGDVMSEVFQKAFIAWFDQHYGARPTATRIDNSINFWVFRETRPEQPVKRGADGKLVFVEHIGFRNRQDDPTVPIERFAKNLKIAQRLLDARGAYIVPMILPSKLTVYPEATPPAWMVPLPEPRWCDEHIYRAFVRALRSEGTDFVDGRELLAMEMGGDLRDRVYSDTGRHLNAAASCLLLRRALDLARPHVTDAVVPPIECRYDMGPANDLEGEERDLYRLLNLWAPMPTSLVAHMWPVEERVPIEERADLLVVGSSFAWRPVFESERNHAFGRIHLFYYNRTVVDRDGRPFYPVPTPNGPEWRAIVMKKKVFVLPMPEEYIGEHNGDFLAELVEALSVRERE